MRAGINVESSESLRIGGGPRSHKVHLGHMLVNTCYVPDDRGLRWLPGLGKTRCPTPVLPVLAWE